MAQSNKATEPASRVDAMVDENGSRIGVPQDSIVKPADDHERTIGATGPTNWWRIGLVAMAIVIGVLLILQFAGGWPGTDVQPGTPTAAPQ